MLKTQFRKLRLCHRIETFVKRKAKIDEYRRYVFRFIHTPRHFILKHLCDLISHPHKVVGKYILCTVFCFRVHKYEWEMEKILTRMVKSV